MIPHERILKAQVAAMPHPLVFATVSGAHLYGFDSPDSDVDLRAAHVLPAQTLLGLQEPEGTVTLERVEDGVEVDLVSHDVRKFFLLMLKRNGYVLEQVLSPLVVQTSEAHRELIELSKGCITRHHAHHYRGFAQTEWKLFEKEQTKRIKPLLYVYRVLLTGIHLMRTGEVVAHLPTLADEHKMPYLHDLIRQKREGTEKGELGDTDIDVHRRRYEALLNRLDAAESESHLPERPSARDGLNDLLVRLRLGTLE